MGNETIKYLTVRETEILFCEIKKDTSRHALRNYTIFRLALYCALRVGEIALLQECDLDSEKWEIYCRREKSSHNNKLRIYDEDLRTLLKEYLQIKSLLYPPSPFLFPSQKGTPISRQMLDNLMKKYCKNTDIPEEKHHFHVLKHTRAVDLADLSLDIKSVQWWLGHRNIQNTLVYMQFTTTQQEALYQTYLTAMQNNRRKY